MRLRERVLSLVRKIPAGKVTTYKELARAAGRPNGWRAVARILATNPHPVEIPCHRVVMSDGRLGGYSLGVRRKEELLRREGVEVSGGRINLEKYMFYFRRASEADSRS